MWYNTLLPSCIMLIMQQSDCDGKVFKKDTWWQSFTLSVAPTVTLLRPPDPRHVMSRSTQWKLFSMEIVPGRPAAIQLHVTDQWILTICNVMHQWHCMTDQWSPLLKEPKSNGLNQWLTQLCVMDQHISLFSKLLHIILMRPVQIIYN